MKVTSSFLIGLILISGPVFAAKKNRDTANQVVNLECQLDNISHKEVFSINTSNNTATSEFFNNGYLAETYDVNNVEINPTRFRIHYEGKGIDDKSYTKYQMTIDRVTGGWEHVKIFYLDRARSQADMEIKKSTEQNLCRKVNSTLKTKF